MKLLVIGHFRVPLCLCFKASLSAKPFLWKWLWLHENEAACRTHFHMKGFALRLALKQRHKRTRKWSINLVNAPLQLDANRPFPSSLVPLFQNESKCETFHMKMSSARSFIFMQIKVIFKRMVSHLDSLWNRGTRKLGNGLFARKQKNTKMAAILE